MTYEEKMNWLKNATPDQLLETYVSMIQNNRYGINTDDIAMVHAELIKRMTKEEHQTEETATEETTQTDPDGIELEDGEYIESYKIVIKGSSVIKRRETRDGAMSQVDKLRSKGKHGTVEAVIANDTDIRFNLVKVF